MRGDNLWRILEAGARVTTTEDMTAAEAVDFDRLHNLRDLGGLAALGGGVTRHGVLFRSESLEHASEADDAHLRHVVGLRTIVDLREVAHADESGRGSLTIAVEGVAPIDYVQLPCHDRDVTPDTRHLYYTGLLQSNGAQFAGLVRRVAAAGTVPMLVHCALGCDRTGTVIAMLLRLAGVTDEEICADYARSAAAAPAIRFRAETLRRAQGLDPLDEAFYGAWANREEIMADTLALVDAKWGSMHGWATTHGLRAGEIDALRTVLIDD